jgi:hypothetical protein
MGGVGGLGATAGLGGVGGADGCARVVNGRSAAVVKSRMICVFIVSWKSLVTQSAPNRAVTYVISSAVEGSRRIL